MRELLTPGAHKGTPAGGAKMGLPCPHAPPPVLAVLAHHRALTRPFMHTCLFLELLCREGNGIQSEPLFCPPTTPTPLESGQAGMLRVERVPAKQSFSKEVLVS